MNRCYLMKKILLSVLLVLVQLFFVNAKQPPVQKVRIALKWSHQFQFAGYYAAFEKGFYKEHGIDVEFIEGDAETSSIDHVLSERAQFGVGNVDVLVRYLKGDPLILLASVVQHSPSILIVKAGSAIYNPHDLVHKTVMLQDNDRDYELLSMLYSEGVRVDQIHVVDHTHSLNELLADQVDAVSAYLTSEPFFLDAYGIPYRTLNPAGYGVDFYSDCLFTRKQVVEQSPQLVENVLQASLKGWEYALNNKEEIATLIAKKYSQLKTFEQLMYEAESFHSIINPELVAIGHTNQGRWFSMANFLHQQGMVDLVIPLDGFFYKGVQDHKLKRNRIFSLYIPLTFLGMALLVLAVLCIRFGLNVRRHKRVIIQLQEQLAEKIGENSVEEGAVLAQPTLQSKGLSEIIGFLEGIFERVGVASQRIHRLLNEPEDLESLAEHKSSLKESLEWLHKDIADVLADSSEHLDTVYIQPMLIDFVNEFVVEHQLDNNRIQLKPPLQMDNSMLLMDKDRVLRVFRSLIAGAMISNPEVKMNIGWNFAETGWVTFWASDNETTLSIEELSSFNQFFSNSVERFSSNSGYVFTVVKSLVRLMHGKLWVTYEQGVGTIFFFKIPRIEA